MQHWCNRQIKWSWPGFNLGSLQGSLCNCVLGQVIIKSLSFPSFLTQEFTSVDEYWRIIKASVMAICFIASSHQSTFMSNNSVLSSDIVDFTICCPLRKQLYCKMLCNIKVVHTEIPFTKINSVFFLHCHIGSLDNVRQKQQ